MGRREFLGAAVAGLLLLAGLARRARASEPESAPGGPTGHVEPLRVEPEAWRPLVSPEAYATLFEEATERPFSSPLEHEKRAGTFVCAACFLPLFASAAKFDSGTGWPSFFDSLPKRVGTRRDFALVLPRTEYHCARCGGHQGHVFDDGPKPTGKRFCNNGVALRFVPEAEALPALRRPA